MVPVTPGVVTVSCDAVKLVIEPLAAVKLPVLRLAVVKFVTVPLAAVKLVIVAFAAVKFVIVAFAAVKFVIVALPAVKLAVELLVEVTITELITVKVPTVKALTLKLVTDDVAVGEQLTVEFPARPSPHCNTLSAPFANAFCRGSVITNPELTSKVAKTLLILVVVVLGVVLIFVISRPLKYQ